MPRTVTPLQGTTKIINDDHKGRTFPIDQVEHIIYHNINLRGLLGDQQRGPNHTESGESNRTQRNERASSQIQPDNSQLSWVLPPTDPSGASRTTAQNRSKASSLTIQVPQFSHSGSRPMGRHLRGQEGSRNEQDEPGGTSRDRRGSTAHDRSKASSLTVEAPQFSHRASRPSENNMRGQGGSRNEQDEQGETSRDRRGSTANDRNKASSLIVEAPQFSHRASRPSGSNMRGQGGSRNEQDEQGGTSRDRRGSAAHYRSKASSLIVEAPQFSHSGSRPMGRNMSGKGGSRNEQEEQAGTSRDRRGSTAIGADASSSNRTTMTLQNEQDSTTESQSPSTTNLPEGDKDLESSSNFESRNSPTTTKARTHPMGISSESSIPTSDNDHRQQQQVIPGGNNPAQESCSLIIIGFVILFSWLSILTHIGFESSEADSDSVNAANYDGLIG